MDMNLSDRSNAERKNNKSLKMQSQLIPIKYLSIPIEVLGKWVVWLV